MSDSAAAYDQLAERWLDAAFDPLNGLQQHERALAFLGEGAGGWALNAGCGCNTRFNPLMRTHGLEIEGIDVSARMLALAQAADPDLTLHHADICDWRPPRSYRFVTACDSIWHVRLDQQRPLMPTLGIPGLLAVIAEADCVCRHLEFDQYPQKHLYLIGQRRS